MKKIVLTPVLMLLVLILFSSAVVSQTSTGAISQTTAEQFCGASTYGVCSTDSDCATGGCSGQICGNINDVNQMSSDCLWHDCYNDEAYGVACGCVEGKCQWFSSTTTCKGEGESIPVIANPPECCAGLTLIPPKEQNLVGINGYCTANCGNGVCERIETTYNCPGDCEESPKLVAFWKFEGNAEDSSGNGHTGTVFGPSPAPGVSGQAYWFDGVNDSISFGNILGNEIKNAFTIGAWIKLDEGALKKTHNYVFWKSDDRPGIRVSNGKVMFTNWQDSEGCCLTSSSSLQEGKWYYLTHVFDGNKFVGYINGNFEASQLNNANYSPGGHILIGGDEKSDYYDRHFKGIIDEVKIWNYALSASQIKEEYTSLVSDAPCICQEVYAPVCGTNGKTYSNKCVAYCANVGIAYEGECISETINAELGEKFKLQEKQTALVQKKNETVMKLRFEYVIMSTCAGGGGGSATATSSTIKAAEATSSAGSATTSSSAGGGSSVAPTCYGGEPYAQFNVSIASGGMHYITLRAGQGTELGRYRITLGYLTYTNEKYTASMLVEETFKPETVIAYLGKPFNLVKDQKAIIKETKLQLELIELDRDVAVLEVSQPVIVKPSPGAGGGGSGGGSVSAPFGGGSGGGVVANAAAVEQPVTTQVTAVEKVQIVEAVRVSTEQGNIIRSPYVKLRVGGEQTIYGHKIKFNSIAAIDCAAGSSNCLGGNVANFTVSKAEVLEPTKVYLDEKFVLVENQTAVVLESKIYDARPNEAMRVKLLGISQTSCEEPKVGEKEKEVICDARPIVKVEVQLPVQECEKATGSYECSATASLLVLREGEERMIGGYVLRLLDVAGNKAVFIVRKSSIPNIIKVQLDEEFKLQQKQTALVVEESLYIVLESIEFVRCGTAETRCIGGSFASVSVWKEFYKKESGVPIGLYKIKEGESLNLYGVKISLLGLDAYGKSAKFVVTKESEPVINVHTNEPFKLQLRQAARVLEANMRIDLMNISEQPIQCIRAPCINPMQVEISVSNYLFSSEATGKAVSSKEYIKTVVQETTASKESEEVAVPVPPQPFQTFVLSEGESAEVNDFVIKLLSVGSAESAEFIVTKRGSGEKLFIEIVKGWNLLSIPGQLDIIESKECDSSNLKVFEYIAKEKKFVKATSGNLGRAYWVFNPGRACSVKAIVRDTVPMSQIDQLVVGWNFVPVTVDMIGSKIRDIAKECGPKAAYFYNANSRKWQNAMDRDLSAADLGKAFAIYATKACSLGSDLTPPMPPLPGGG